MEDTSSPIVMNKVQALYFVVTVKCTSCYMEVDTLHGIHITEKAGSYHMSSENWQINLKACQTPVPIVRRVSC